MLSSALVQEVNGTGLLPAGYRNAEEPSWTEAARWLERNASLFNKGKLNPLRAAIIRETLGEAALWSASCCGNGP